MVFQVFLMFGPFFGLLIGDRQFLAGLADVKRNGNPGYLFQTVGNPGKAQVGAHFPKPVRRYFRIIPESFLALPQGFLGFFPVGNILACGDYPRYFSLPVLHRRFQGTAPLHPPIGERPCGFGDFHPWYSRLFQDPDFAQQWVDRWQELRQSTFTAENFAATIGGMAAELAEAQVRNVQRWPETRPFSGYEEEISRLKNSLTLSLRNTDNRVLPPVTFNKHGLAVPVGFEATLSAPLGTIYYTLDGSDPRAAGGEISTQAIEYTGGPIVINDTTRIVTRTRSEDGGDLNIKWWSAPAIGDFVTNGLVVSKVQYNPHAALPSQGEVNTNNETSSTSSCPIRGLPPSTWAECSLSRLTLTENLRVSTLPSTPRYSIRASRSSSSRIVLRSSPAMARPSELPRAMTGWVATTANLAINFRTAGN